MSKKCEEMVTKVTIAKQSHSVDSTLEVASLKADWCIDDTRVVGRKVLTLSVTATMVKLGAVDVDPAHTGANFEGVFDKKSLVGCGFHERLDVPHMVEIIRHALDEEGSVLAHIEDDADEDLIHLNLEHKSGFGFDLDYTIPLKRKWVDASEKLKTELAAVMFDSKAKDARILKLKKKLAYSKKKIRELEAELSVRDSLISEYKMAAKVQTTSAGCAKRDSSHDREHHADRATGAWTRTARSILYD